MDQILIWYYSDQLFFFFLLFLLDNNVNLIYCKNKFNYTSYLISNYDYPMQIIPSSCNLYMYEKNPYYYTMNESLNEYDNNITIINNDLYILIIIINKIILYI